MYTVNLGYQYSMGFLIGLAGHKRFAVPNAKFLMHDGSNFIWDSGAKAQDKMEFQKKVEARIRQYVVERSILQKRNTTANFVWSGISLRMRQRRKVSAITFWV